MLKNMGLIINYEYCTGCRACQVACQQNGFPLSACGIEVVQVGPIQLTQHKWLFDYIPVKTDICHFCHKRTKQGKLTLCEHHCPTGCITYTDINAYFANNSQVRKVSVYAKN